LLVFLFGVGEKTGCLFGLDKGAAVAVGFAAKYPDLCLSLCLIAPVGIKYSDIENEEMLKRKMIGEYYMYSGRKKLSAKAELGYFDTTPESSHRALIDKQIDMVDWQINNTAGYLGAILSTIRLFPLRGMDELFTAVGRFDRPVLVLWGEDDTITSYSRSINIMERCFPKGYVVGVRECGHVPLAEQFTDVMTELLSFHKIVHEDATALTQKKNQEQEQVQQVQPVGGEKQSPSSSFQLGLPQQARYGGQQQPGMNQSSLGPLSAGQGGRTQSGSGFARSSAFEETKL
jgi:hypothetical protein